VARPVIKQVSRNDLGPPVGLSFLDILCCGLGSVVLIFLILKHGGQPEIPVEVPTVSAIQERQQARLAVVEINSLIKTLIAKQSTLSEEVEKKTNELKGLESADGAVQKSIDSMLNTISLIAHEDAKAEELRSAFRVLDEAPYPLPTPDAEATHISGAVEGIKLTEIDRVVVLVDISASMLHRSLVEIIKLKNQPLNVQLRSKKWRQTMSSAIWAYDSISVSSRFKVLFFSESVYELDGSETSVGRLQWDRKVGEDSLGFRKALDNFSPRSGTDLEKVLARVATLAPRPKKVLIITDGLPNRLSIKKFAKSLRMRGCDRRSFSPDGTTSSECRLSIAMESVGRHAEYLDKVPIDVILFPLDGDSISIRFYSLLTSSANGRVLAPARDWLVQ